jgi:hypothetical protein
MDELVQRLADGRHPVTVGGPQPSLAEFRRRVHELGYVFVKFTGTDGGTDLGVRLDLDASDMGSADFEQGTGTARVVGKLVLNDVPVRCVADIDLASLNGSGHLVVMAGSEG